MYIAAVVSDDLELQDVFRSGGDFHSTIAKKVFKLDCPVEEVATKYTALRQAAKAISFGILYGSGPQKVADTVTAALVEAANKAGRVAGPDDKMTLSEAKGAISDYFGTFWKLKEWIDETQATIKKKAFIYSPLGRKRRLVNVRSDNPGVVGHEIRSGLNFIIQSVASDINLLGAIDAQTAIKKLGMNTKIFALVHDSVLAEVPEEELDAWCTLLKGLIQKDRGVSIPGCPIKCDFEIGDDYSFGKFAKKYENDLTELGMEFELPE